jgi:hypothetical protein
LDHEAFDHPVKVKTIIETVLRKADEIPSCDGHLAEEDLDHEGPEGGVKRRDWVGH